LIVLLLRGNSQISPDQLCRLVPLGLIDPTTPPSLWPPLVGRWASGKTLICENQITLDLIDQPLAFGLSSVVAFSLDDVGMTDNQLEITSTNVFFLVDALVAAFSVRLADNRLSETWFHAAFSALTLGLMNTTTDNQSTHCLLARGLPNLRVFTDNRALIQGFCPQQCGDIR